MALAAGDLLQDRYRIDSELGQGGMASVYWAWDTHLDLSVAVKEMGAQPGLGPEALAQLRRQFKREAHILARLSHPNLVRVTDSFSQQDSEYLVMNFVEGESLADRVDRVGALPEAQVLDWADQLLSALAYCHSQGIIHRDVKSHNVIIRPDEQAVLVDFGLVKLWDPSDPHTKTVMRGMGTPAFAPPEQFETNAEHTDERSDLYSMGATLYHVLTARLPETAAMRTATPEKFVPLRSVAPDVSQKTETVVMKAMELARSKRWQSTNEMAKALKASELSTADQNRKRTLTIPLWRGGTGVLPGGEPTAKDQRRRRPVWIGALGILTVLVVAGGLIMRPGGIGNRSTPVPSSEGTATASTPAAFVTPDTTAQLPVSTPVVTPSPTPTATATRQLTDTPSPTSTETPSPTSTFTPTPTPSPTMTGTPTRAPTASHTPIATQEATRETPTPTATPTPTVKPTVSLLQLYAAPALIEPLSNRIIGFDRKQIIHLLWAPTSLEGDHWYEVQLSQEEDEAPRGRYWTRENWWDMGPEYFPGDYYWRVIIVQGRGNDVVGAVSPPSETWYFQWISVAPTSTPGARKPTSTPQPPADTPTSQPPTSTPVTPTLRPVNPTDTPTP